MLQLPHNHNINEMKEEQADTALRVGRLVIINSGCREEAAAADTCHVYPPSRALQQQAEGRTGDNTRRSWLLTAGTSLHSYTLTLSLDYIWGNHTIIHSSNLTLFQSYSLPILHCSNLTLLQCYSLKFKYVAVTICGTLFALT